MSAQQVFFVTARGLTVYRSERGCYTEAFSFAADDAGLDGFSRYLRESGRITSLMLVDLIEEEFRTEAVPHVLPWDQPAMLQRVGRRQFRATPFVHVEVQGRSPEGRRDDHVLISALTNPELINRWLERLGTAKVPLKAISSAPYCASLLLERLRVTASNLLLVTGDEAAGLRQTYFHEGRLKLSRLSPMPLECPDTEYAEYALEEVTRTQRYLQHQQFLGADAQLEVHIVARGPVLELLRQRGGNDVRLTLWELAVVARSARLHGAPVLSASLLLSHLLGTHRKPNIYARAPSLKYHTHAQAARAIDFVGAALLLSSAGLFINNGASIYEAVSSAAEAESRADQYRELYLRSAAESLPAEIDPDRLRSVVVTADALHSNLRRPDRALAQIGQVLEALPLLTLDAIEWASDTAPRFSFGEQRLEGPPELFGRGPGPYEGALVHGRIVPFDGDFRAALEQVERFAEAVRRLPGVAAVTVPVRPLDVQEVIAGKAAFKDGGLVRAPFTLGVVWAP